MGVTIEIVALTTDKGAKYVKFIKYVENIIIIKRVSRGRNHPRPSPFPLFFHFLHFIHSFHFFFSNYSRKFETSKNPI